MNNKIYIIWIGGIGISAIARYYLAQWYSVYWNDAAHSVLTENLEKEWVLFCNLIEAIERNRTLGKWKLAKVIYTEAVPKDNHELLLAKENDIEILSYPQALAEIANDKKLIAIAGTHGKSTTTSLTSLVLKNSKENFTSVVWTLLKEFENKNFYHRQSPTLPPGRGKMSEGQMGVSDDHFFVIEACEYKRSFLNYKPTVWIITNIEVDHLDYFADEADYLSAYKSFIDNIKSWGFVILNGDDANCQKLVWLREDIQYIEVFDDYFSFDEKLLYYPKLQLQVAGNHILFDAKIAYIVWHMLGLPNEKIVEALENYTWVWRRMEIIKTTDNWNILMSDYGHHPTEISLTLDALKEKYPDKKLYTVFQPHQYNRTLELIEEFKSCFTSADTLVIPNIYESRDSEADKVKMPLEKFVSSIEHDTTINWKGLENTFKRIKKYDAENPDSSIILLLWAWNVDTLRYEI
jgi:UDP-N-acetylmuramate--alanine ligase